MCGVFGIAGNPEAAKLTYLGLHALQHRGQESAGLVVSDDSRASFRRHLGMGLVADVFTPAAMEPLTGDRAIGHVRYSTAGGSDIRNGQPMTADTIHGPIAVAHNGNLVNAIEIRKDLEREGAIFTSTSDTEIIVHLLARAKAPRFVDRVRAALAQIRGAYTLLLMSKEHLIGLRDPSGFRPLVIGKLKDRYVLASETCALDLIEADLVREVEPGEMVIIDKNGIRSEMIVHEPDAKQRACIFELIYFARPDSSIFGADVYEARVAFGRQLAKEAPADADIVIPVPDSGVPAALGFADESGLPFRHGLLRSHYVGRTFIEPAQSIRHFGVKLKLSAVRAVLRNKRVVVVDDSLVRGTTSRKIVKMIRAAGAKEVHLRISSPPTRFPCYYGIDTPNRQELIAATHSLDEIKTYTTADSLAYVSEEGLHQAAKDGAGQNQRFCDACFSGRYSVSLSQPESSTRLPVLDPIPPQFVEPRGD
jgi:amidophosphoribosyltransferase